MTEIRFLGCLLLSLLLAVAASAQGLWVEGRVVDERQQPVPYASVGWANGSGGTATNEIGEFRLRAPALPLRLVVLSMGYGRTEVEVSAVGAPLTLVLQASAVVLPEVTVRNPDKVALELVQRASAKLLRHARSLQYGKAFYRQKTRQNGQYREFFDAFYDVKFSNRVIEGWDLAESRYAFTPGGFTFTNFSSLIRRVPVFSRHPFREKLLVPLGPDAAKNFRFTLRSIISEAGRETAVIDFEPKSQVSKPATAGTLYIDVATAALRRQEQEVSLSSMLSFRMEPEYQRTSDHFRLVSDFAPLDDSLTRLASTRAESSIVFSRAHARPDSTQVAAQLVFYQYTPRLPGHAYQEVGRHSRDLQQVMKQVYNPQFWLENEVLRASPIEEKVIKDFEGRKVFGQL
ncbi:carboxypeptidase-like regulatory domain-containing protein [Hymenobacter canadensis]|uniref:Carboxypeptidase-like regulatory domain-containing protein n=1 Tax=Hymenobacter canadensis TaxID=2999067 RepID=A0ABY7LQP9_9BACT|nr:carboxypeptidase-like regulatory domain-containing protein [Hymenobacter canadensis]WBA42236.1 carboxypeptidase-like regulatory domain-containing protein [Hymenobacter canadensis]